MTSRRAGLYLRAAAATVAVAGLAVMPALSAQAAVSSYTFETDTSGFVPTTTGTASASRTTTNARTGTGALAVAIDGTSETDGALGPVAAAAVTGAGTVSVSGWARYSATSGSTTVRACVVYTSGGTTTSSCSAATTVAQSYVQVSQSAAIPATATNLRAKLTGGANGGSVRWDDVTLDDAGLGTSGSTATPTPTPTATATATPTPTPTPTATATTAATPAPTVTATVQVAACTTAAPCVTQEGGGPMYALLFGVSCLSLFLLAVLAVRSVL